MMPIVRGGMLQKPLIMCGVSCLTLWVLWSVVYAPLIDRLTDRQQQLQELELERDHVVSLVSRRSAIEASAEELSRQLGDAAADSGAVVGSVEAIARRCGLTVLAVQPREVRPGSASHVSSVDLECQGALSQIAHCIYELQAHSPTTVVRQLRLAPQLSSIGGLLSRFTVQRAHFVDEALAFRDDS